MLPAIVVNSASMLLESVPFIIAAAMVAPLAIRWLDRLVPYFGCGCGTGPSARSLPAAAAAFFVFGPLVAIGRVMAAIVVDRAIAYFQRRGVVFGPPGGDAREDCATRSRCSDPSGSDVLGQLRGVALPAIASAIVVPLLPAIAGWHAAPAALFAATAAAAFVTSPCGLGTVAAAAMLRTFAPAAAAGFLCIAGIADLRAFLCVRSAHRADDVLAHALAAMACALAALRGGSGLLNPKLALAMWPCAIVFGALAIRKRGSYCPLARIAPAIMLAGTIAAAPAPAYHATETTLAGAFAGERIDFTGAIERAGGHAALVRYAITCCRADAAPVVIGLEGNIRLRAGWAHASGTLVERRGQLRLHIASLIAQRAPPDPFVYR